MVEFITLAACKEWLSTFVGDVCIIVHDFGEIERKDGKLGCIAGKVGLRFYDPETGIRYN